MGRGRELRNAAEPCRQLLLEWWSRNQRDLPWRRTRDPWAVLVSELMLQQTQVDRVRPKYVAFMARFPTSAACAAAPPGEVVRLWAGLGYNRRALHLHGCAVAVCRDNDGRLPETLDGLLALPGIGPYTARAVLAFAFERDVGVVDTNAARVLARWAGRALSASEVQSTADAAVPLRQGWAWNQAMLDFGASVCTNTKPRCAACPVAETCAWAQAGWPAPDPAVGSAGVSGAQSRFAGSDRQSRGRLVDALRAGPVVADAQSLAEAMGCPGDPRRAERVAHTLVDDGLAVRDAAPTGPEAVLRLP